MIIGYNMEDFTTLILSLVSKRDNDKILAMMVSSND